MIAPDRTKVINPWEGSYYRKPWHYNVTAVIPIIDAGEELDYCIDLLRLQTEKPFIILIDTGSEYDERIYEDYDIETHYLRLTGVKHPSELITAAMDLAFSICRTEHIYCTHSDVFIQRKDLLEDLLKQCNEYCPAVGYEVSSREKSAYFDGHKGWKGKLGHTCSMFHMPTMDKIGVGWSIRRLSNQDEWKEISDSGKFIPQTGGWPDTETLIGWKLAKNRITPKIIGIEEDGKRTLDKNIDHCRSFTGSRLYARGYYENKALPWIKDGIENAKKLKEQWIEKKQPIRGLKIHSKPKERIGLNYLLDSINLFHGDGNLYTTVTKEEDADLTSDCILLDKINPHNIEITDIKTGLIPTPDDFFNMLYKLKQQGVKVARLQNCCDTYFRIGYKEGLISQLV